MSFPKLDVLLSPVEFESLPGRDLSATCCVVFDVLRATSTMTVALANGATGILPCGYDRRGGRRARGESEFAVGR